MITDLAFAPDGSLFLLGKDGSLWRAADGERNKTPLLTLSVSAEAERGLLGIAFDPTFQTNHWIYLYYTTGPGSRGYAGAPKNRVARFTLSEDSTRVDPESEVILLDGIASDAGIHNGGALAFGGDGKIYIATGDGGARPKNAQDLASLNGKILRVDPDGTIPADNPFVGRKGVRKEIFMYGLRNPWRFTFHPDGKRLIIADVGSSKFEEVNVGGAGANFGWPMTEGRKPAGVRGVTYPLYDYTRTKKGASIIGGEVYKGTQFPKKYRGAYFFGDFVLNFIRTMVFDSRGRARVETFDPKAGWMVDMTFGPDGALYYSIGDSPSTGHVQRIAYVGKERPTHHQKIKARASQPPAAGNTPPVPTITAPRATHYVAGEEIQFSGSATDAEDGALPAGSLTWEVSFRHGIHAHPFLGPLRGVAEGTFTIPTVGEAATDVVYEIRLTARDSAGASKTVSSPLLPKVTEVTLKNTVRGGTLLLDDGPVNAPYTFSTVVGFRRIIAAPKRVKIGKKTYRFVRWSDGKAREHMIMPKKKTTYTAQFEPSP